MSGIHFFKSYILSKKNVVVASIVGSFFSILVLFQNFTFFTNSSTTSNSTVLPNGTRDFNIADVSSIDFTHLDFSTQRADFNGDGILDTLSCSNAQKKITIIDGANPRNVSTLWTGPTEWTTPSYSGLTKTFSFTGCSIITLDGRKHIVVSTLLSHQRDGARIRSTQYVLVNKGNMNFKRSEIRLKKNTTEFSFRAASRSVKCKEYSKRLTEGLGIFKAF